MKTDNVTNQNAPLVCAIFAAGALLTACSISDGSPPLFSETGVGGQSGSSGAGTAGTAATGAAGSTVTGSASAGSGGSSGAGGSAVGASAGGSSAAGGSSGAGGSAGGAAGTDAGSFCPNPDLDTDGDGTPDCSDGCPYDKNKVAPGICFCGFPENDSDGDGVVDCLAGHFYEAENGQLSTVDNTGSATDASASADAAASVGFLVGADPAASNGHYIVAPATRSESQPGSARASYDLNVTEAGMYVIWGRFLSPDVAHDCVWARIDGETWSTWRGPTGEEWVWYHFHKDGEWDTPLQFQLLIGHHTLEIANCTDNTKLDRLYVTAGGDKPPGNNMCNPPHTVEMGGACVSSCGMLGGTSCDPAACAGQILLPAYDCTVCCTPSAEAGTKGDAASADAGATE